MNHQIHLTINGNPYDMTVKSWETLLDVLVREFKLPRTKEGCGVGECGTCTVIINGKTFNSCLVLAVDTNGKDIVTMEGLAEEREFHPLAESLTNKGVMRAAFSPPGIKDRHEFFTFCHVCPGHCSIKATVENGKVVDIAPDMESGLPNELCPVKKSRFSIPEVINHPERLLYPLKRVGKKGEGKWERISWDEALDTIAKRLTEIKQQFGPEAVAFCLGEPKGMEFAFAQRFATVFGTPNVVTPGWCCGVPSGTASAFTYGANCVPDEETYPRLIVMWACNLTHTSGGMRRESLEAALEEGGKLIVIDPRKTGLASIADLWIKLKPGSDGALAMGVLKVIIEEKIYDEDFVSNWTIGFDQLKEEIKKFSLEEVERVTWVPKSQIEEFARLYAKTKPAAIQWGNALDGVVNSFQAARAISILRTITGNLNIPGGDIFLTPAPFVRPGRFFLINQFPRDINKTLGNEFKVAMQSAFIPPIPLINAILEEDPYPVKAAFCILTNPIVSYPDSLRTFKAFSKIDFLVVSDLFMTPTAALADIVLPASWGMEHEELGYWPGWYEEIRVYPKIVDPPGECWADTKIINELAKRLGLNEFFWNNDEDALDYMLEPSGLSYEELKEKRVLHAKREYKRVFKTPSGKAEIYSKRLEEMGFSPLPYWAELSKLPETSDEYPLLLTNGKEETYMLGSYKHVASLRNMRPEPVVELNTETAKKLGLKDGEWVYLETKTGRIKQRLSLNPYLNEKVVIAAFGWWFPEEKDTLYGWDKSNINVLISSDPPYDFTTGIVDMKGVPCKVYKAYIF
jgi:anaerobic selenocysteine-containing dehydrogenase